MKNLKVVSALAVALGVALAGAAMAATPDGGTITFTGEVTDVTCTIKGGAGTNGGANNFLVALAAAEASTLATVGATANPKAFSVEIGGHSGDTGCPGGKISTMSFSTASPQIDAATGALRNALVNEATNVEIQLTDASGTAIDLADPTYNQDVTMPATGPGVLEFQAQYLAVGGAATPGLISTSVVYGVTYN